jgi:hypothetical protein
MTWTWTVHTLGAITVLDLMVKLHQVSHHDSHHPHVVNNTVYRTCFRTEGIGSSGLLFHQDLSDDARSYLCFVPVLIKRPSVPRVSHVPISVE